MDSDSDEDIPLAHLAYKQRQAQQQNASVLTETHDVNDVVGTPKSILKKRSTSLISADESTENTDPMRVVHLDKMPQPQQTPSANAIKRKRTSFRSLDQQLDALEEREEADEVPQLTPNAIRRVHFSTHVLVSPVPALASADRPVRALCNNARQKQYHHSDTFKLLSHRDESPEQNEPVIRQPSREFLTKIKNSRALSMVQNALADESLEKENRFIRPTSAPPVGLKSLNDSTRTSIASNSSKTRSTEAVTIPESIKQCEVLLTTTSLLKKLADPSKTPRALQMILHSREIDTIGQLASMSADEVSTLPMRGGKHKYRVLVDELNAWLDESKWTLEESVQQPSEAKENLEEDESVVESTNTKSAQEACEEDNDRQDDASLLPPCDVDDNNSECSASNRNETPVKENIVPESPFTQWCRGVINALETPPSDTSPHRLLHFFHDITTQALNKARTLAESMLSDTNQ